MSQDSNQSKMAEKLEAQGLSNPESKFKWHDGSDHDDVTKIHVRGDAEGIQFIKFDYFGTGQLIDASLHGFSNQGFTQMFEIDHSNGEHLLSVEAYHDREVIQGLQFKTNWKFSEIMGYDKAYSKFTLAVDGKKIIGFHGSAKANLNSLGAYVTSITPTKLETKGGKGGKEWNDGPDYEAVTKIHVRAGVKGIHNIKFDYLDKDGHSKEGPTHGSTSAGGFTLEPFEINHDDKEYLLFIDGYYNETSGVIQGLQFKTNMKTSELMGCYDDETDTKFSLGSNSNKIIGFHGYAEKYLNSLGAYFTSLPLTRGDLCHNGNTGYVWDDGTFQGVRKVYVYYDSYSMRCVRFDYDNNGKVETREHGSKAAYPVQESEFVVDYPNEFLTSVEGTSVYRYPQSMITSLIFKTSKGRASPIFGNAFSDDQLVRFVLERKGCAFVGFHGRSLYGLLNALGAYFFPMPPPHDGEKLEE